jgi:hypothetical protein
MLDTDDMCVCAYWLGLVSCMGRVRRDGKEICIISVSRPDGKGNLCWLDCKDVRAC